MIQISLLMLVLSMLAACSGDDPADVPDDAVTFTMTGVDSLSVFSILQRNHAIGFRETALGFFVTAIEGIKNADSGYWTYMVNGEAPKVAADKFLTGAGDTIVWIYQPIDR